MAASYSDILESSAASGFGRRSSVSSASSTPHKRAAASPACDRFIPNRSAMDFSAAAYALSENTAPAAAGGSSTPSKADYDSQLRETLFNGSESAKILAFKNKAPQPSEGTQNNLKVLYSSNRTATTKRRRNTRVISQAPERILDAPELIDDYYLNLLDWNKDNILAVALGETVYLWNASSGSITELCQTTAEDDYITSIAWIQEGNYLAVGTNNADVQLWDTEALKEVRNMKGHCARVGALAWNSFLLSSGSRDSTIFNHDVRVADHHVATLEGHTQEVCGLKWSPSGTQLASGGNDNLLNIWDVNTGFDAPKHTMTHHTAAVKALAWCPWQANLLASGGGTADRHIRFWNTQTGAMLNEIDTNSQVCSIQWSTHHKELVSSHGFSQNQLIIWKYPTMVKSAELTGHTSRVLHLALSPDGETVVSAAGDETLRFWNCFAADSKSKKKSGGSTSSGSLLRTTNIR